MMTDVVIGKTKAEALALAEEFFLLVQDKIEPNEKHLGEAIVLNGVAKFPARIKCATLAWKALERAILQETPRRSDRPERRREIPGPHQMRHFGLEGFGKSDSPRQKRKRGRTSGIPA